MIVDYALLAFYAFAALSVMSAVAVISVRNPVHAALFLVLTFFTVACTWILAGAEFLGVALILVYVGAVMVLFLFVVMMLDIDIVELREGYVRYLPVGLVVAVVMLGEMLVLIGVRSRMDALPVDAAVTAGVPNTTWLARAMFSDFVLPFEIAAVILTIAVIAAVMLTLRRRTGTKHQNPSEQGRVRAADRFRMVSMASEPPRQPLQTAATDEPPAAGAREPSP
jgi:NADH-quinone oxidoreductase subunit J